MMGCALDGSIPLTGVYFEVTAWEGSADNFSNVCK